MITINFSRFVASVAMAIGITSMAQAQTTYSWVGNSSDFAVPTNWIPDRNTPANTDTLSFTNGVPITITNITGQTIRALHVSNNTDLTWSVPAARTLSIVGDGTAAADLTVAAGSKLRWSGSFAFTLSVLATGTGSIDGDVIFTSTGNSIAHRLLGVNQGGSVEGITFNSGSTFQFAPGGTGAGSPFGSLAPVYNSIRFAEGSTFYQGGTVSGPSVGSGTHPFGATQPNSVVYFDPGSTFHTYWTGLNVSGRNYGNLIVDNRTGTQIPGGGVGSPAWNVKGNMTIKSTCSGFNWDGSANPLITIDGDLIVEANASFGDTNGPTAQSRIDVGGDINIASSAATFPTSTAHRVYKLIGSTQQDVFVEQSGAGSKKFPALQVDNPDGARLMSNVGVNGPLVLTNGEVDTNGNVLTASDGASNVTRTNGFVRGALVRELNAANTGVRSFPVGTANKYAGVDVNITAAGAGSGSVTVTPMASVHPNAVAPANALAYHWDISAPGITLAPGSATLTFNYSDSDLNGATESDMVAGRYDGEWEILGATINTVANTATVTGVSNFSTWSLGDATALPVSLSGFSID